MISFWFLLLAHYLAVLLCPVQYVEVLDGRLPAYERWEALLPLLLKFTNGMLNEDHDALVPK